MSVTLPSTDWKLPGSRQSSLVEAPRLAQRTDLVERIARISERGDRTGIGEDVYLMKRHERELIGLAVAHDGGGILEAIAGEVAVADEGRRCGKILRGCAEKRQSVGARDGLERRQVGADVMGERAIETVEGRLRRDRRRLGIEPLAHLLRRGGAHTGGGGW